MKDEATKKAADTAFLLMLGLPVLVLRDKWGFGKVRLERFIDQVDDVFDSIDKDYVTIEDLRKVILDETGIDVK